HGLFGRNPLTKKAFPETVASCPASVVLHDCVPFSLPGRQGRDANRRLAVVGILPRTKKPLLLGFTNKMGRLNEPNLLHRLGESRRAKDVIRTLELLLHVTYSMLHE